MGEDMAGGAAGLKEQHGRGTDPGLVKRTGTKRIVRVLFQRVSRTLVRLLSQRCTHTLCRGTLRDDQIFPGYLSGETSRWIGKYLLHALVYFCPRGCNLIRFTTALGTQK